jgi:hydroxyethylthiazole kinase
MGANTMSDFAIHNDLFAIQTQAPLIHHLTNFVSMQTCANVLLAIGASPIMAHAKDELRELLSISQALVLNIGTLDEYWVDAMFSAQKIALQFKMPIILDPVGSGASKLRTNTAKRILEAGVSIVRGNSSEIMSLVDDRITTRGVDSTATSNIAVPAAQQLANTYQCVIIVSGAVDYIVAPSGDYLTNSHGTELLTRVTAMGCAASSVVAAFAAVNNNYFQAAHHAMSAFCLAGEQAAAVSAGPGSFAQNILDRLSNYSGRSYNSNSTEHKDARLEMHT